MKEEKTKTGKLDKNKNTKQPGERPTLSRTRIILDALIFLIILLAVSLSMIIISSALEEPKNFYVDYSNSNEYIDHSMQSILHSTVPKTEYYNIKGERTEYIGQSIERLIIIDLNIRSSCAGDSNFNQSSLEMGIESELEAALNIILGDDTKYVFAAEIKKSDNSEVNDAEFILSNAVNPPEIEESTPSYEKHLTPPIDSLGINIDTSLVMIKLYLI